MRRTRLLALLTLVTCLVFSGLAMGQETINNSMKPEGGVVQTQLKELWRLGGDDDELFFGTVGRIHQAADNNLYILDGQLCVAHVVNDDGEVILSMGAEGDGPGEFRGPSDLFVMNDGTVNVLQGFPGKVIRLDNAGNPAGTAHFSVDGTRNQFGVMRRGLAVDDGMLLVGMEQSFGGSSISNQMYYLAHTDRDGNQITRLVEKKNVIDYSDFQLTEKGMDFIWSRFDLGPDGLLYVIEDRDAYSIKVMDLKGNLKRIINREYKAPARTEREKEIQNQIIDAVAGYYPAPLKGKSIEEFGPAVQNLWVTRDNRIWVQPDLGEDDLPEGTWMLFDVFSADGTYEKQVALEGHFHRFRDSAQILPDGRIVVITGALDAFLNQMGAGGGDEEVDPLEIICYELEM